MVQPYEPGKIPVLMVHGLWSSPMTWMEMFNDLRSQPRNSRSLPVLVLPLSDGPAVLAERRPVAARSGPASAQLLDPPRQEPALDQMVLIGHSMGGLLSRLQTIQSSDDYWRLVSNEPFPQIKADPKCEAEAARDVLLPAQPLDPPRGHDRHAAPRQQFRQPRRPNGCSAN